MLPQVSYDRYSQQKEQANFSEVCQSIDLVPFYQTINDKLEEVSEYVNTWLSY